MEVDKNLTSRTENLETKYSSADSDSKSSWHQLLIIGNGFDLECGLNSSWKGFFLERRNKLDNLAFPSSEEELNKWKELCVNAGLTLWDIKLAQGSEENWYNIEGRLLELLLSYWKWLPHSELDSELDDIYRSKSLQPTNQRYYQLICYLACFLSHNECTNTELLKFLRSELTKLEHAFSVHLQKHLLHADRNQPEGYMETASRNLQALLCHPPRPTDPHAKSYSVLSFNYTGPFELHTDEIEICTAYINIHGRCHEDNEIIFGIDGKENLENEITRPFTKTYRLLGLGGPQAHDVVSANTRCIKFYGHSLSDADYSYFQAIFDAVHLYSSDVSLIFFYRSFDERDPLIHRREMMDKVINLLTAYGTTLENRDHGKNLIHKLLLEGRLKVQEINFPTQSDIVD